MAMKYWCIIQVCLSMAHMLNTPFPAFICCNSHLPWGHCPLPWWFHLWSIEDSWWTWQVLSLLKQWHCNYHHPSPSTRTRAGRVCVINCATPSFNHIECLVTCFSVRNNKNKQTNLKFEKCLFPLYVAISACPNFAGQQMDRCLWHATCRVWHEIPQLCLIILPLYSYIIISIYTYIYMYGYVWIFICHQHVFPHSTALFYGIPRKTPVAKTCSSRPEPWVSWQQRQRGVHLSRLGVCIGYIYIQIYIYIYIPMIYIYIYIIIYI